MMRLLPAPQDVDQKAEEVLNVALRTQMNGGYVTCAYILMTMGVSRDEFWDLRMRRRVGKVLRTYGFIPCTLRMPLWIEPDGTPSAALHRPEPAFFGTPEVFAGVRDALWCKVTIQ